MSELLNSKIAEIMGWGYEISIFELFCKVFAIEGEG